MPLTLIQKLQMIEGRHWQSLGYEFLDATAKEAAEEITRLRLIVADYQAAYGGAAVTRSGKS